MGSASQPLSAQSQILNQTQAFTTDATGAATITFPNPPAGFTWTGTLNCAAATTGAVFLATVGGVSWGEWGGNSVYGPVQVLGQGSQQLIVSVTGLLASTSYSLQWNGSSDLSANVAAVWPDTNSTALTAQISGTVPVSVAGTVTTTGTTSITGGSVGITGSVATTVASTLTTATGSGSSTTLSVASASAFPSQGLISVTASGGTLLFIYTGKTGTSFTGLTLLSGTVSWTIAVGASVIIAQITNVNGGSLSTVTTVGSITNPVSSNPLAPDADVINVGTSTFTPPTTVTFQNASEVDTYTGFLLTLDSWPAGWGTNSGLRVVATNPVTKQTITLLNSQIANLGTRGLQFYFPLSVNAGDTFTIVGTVQNTSGISGTLSWTISGFRQPPYTAVQTNPNASLDVVPYGGTSEYASNLATLTNISYFGAAGVALRIHSVAAYMTSAGSAITGTVLWNDANSGNPICALDMTQGTSATHGAFAYLGGLLLMPPNPTTGQAGIQLTNFTNKTVNMVARYDLVQIPNIG